MPKFNAVLVWCGIAVMWVFLTHRSHPSLPVAIWATVSMVGCFAMAALINHRVLIPSLRLSSARLRYWTSLVLVMLVLTGVALLGVHLGYRVLGPYQTGAIPKHYAIDFFGMCVHVGGAWVVARLWRRGQSRDDRV